MANNNSTTPLSNQFSRTLGAGVSSLVSPGSKSYYILEHCVSSKFHQMGEAQKIIVDNIEIGRDPRCQVRFDENFKTVSRRHAAIVRDGDNWKLVQISKTNSTLLNGRRISTEWYLQSGDEIQISVNGPKLRFIIPTGDKASMGSINFTQRFDLFRKQALKPYKWAMVGMAGVLVVAVAAIVYLAVFTKGVADDVESQGRLLAEEIENNSDNVERTDSLCRELLNINQAVAHQQLEMQNVKQMAENAQRRAAAMSRNMAPTPEAFAEVSKNVYYLIVGVYLDDEFQFAFSGTGFLLEDGRFVTAKHCVDMGYHHAGDFDDETMATLNSLHYFQPESLKYKFIAVSGAGDRITFEYTPQSSIWEWGYTNYETGTTSITDGEGNEILIPVKYSDSVVGADDWAYFSTGKSGGLKFDAEWSANLGAGTKLHILGFPRSVGTEEFTTTGRVSPNYVESSVGQSGLYDGIILLANDEVDSGNSGGPVFAQRDGQPIVIGIISGKERLGARTGESSAVAKWKSRVVPLSAMY